MLQKGFVSDIAALLPLPNLCGLQGECYVPIQLHWINYAVDSPCIIQRATHKGGRRDIDAGKVRSGPATPDCNDSHVTGVHSIRESELQRCIQNIATLRESPVVIVTVRRTVAGERMTELNSILHLYIYILMECIQRKSEIAMAFGRDKCFSHQPLCINTTL